MNVHFGRAVLSVSEGIRVGENGAAVTYLRSQIHAEMPMLLRKKVVAENVIFTTRHAHGKKLRNAARQLS